METTYELSRTVLTSITDLIPALEGVDQEKAVEIRDVAKKMMVAHAPALPNRVVQGYRRDLTEQLAWFAQTFCGVDVYDKTWSDEELRIVTLWTESIAKKANRYKEAQKFAQEMGRRAQ